MPTWSTILTFAAATVGLLLIPGPAIFYILNRSVSDGREVGLAAVAGLEVGDTVQVIFASAGLSTIIATSATAFNVVKWAGALYLIVTGINTIRKPPPPIDPDQPGVGARKAFRQGIIVNSLNPKTALFFLSIFPQFIDPDRGALGQSLVLGAVFVLLATVFNGSYALIAASLRDLLLRGRGLTFFRRWVAGGMFMLLGALAATASASGHTPRQA